MTIIWILAFTRKESTVVFGALDHTQGSKARPETRR